MATDASKNSSTQITGVIQDTDQKKEVITTNIPAQKLTVPTDIAYLKVVPLMSKLPLDPFTGKPVPSPFTPPVVIYGGGGGGGGGGFSGAPAGEVSSPTNITPPAAIGQTPEVVAAQTVTANQIQQAINNINAGNIATRQQDLNAITQAIANVRGVTTAQVTPIMFARYANEVINNALIARQIQEKKKETEQTYYFKKTPETFLRGTATNLAPAAEYNVQFLPYVKKEITGYDIINNIKTPMVKYTFVNPTELGKQQERPATPEEIKEYESTGRISEAKLTTYKIVSETVKEDYNLINEDMKKSFTYPVFSFLDEQKYSEVLAATLLTPAYVLGKQTREMARGFKVGAVSYGAPTAEYNVQFLPYVKKEITGYDIINNIKTPMVKYTFINPTELGKQQERPATPEEIKEYESTGRIFEAKLTTYKIVSETVKEDYNLINEDVKKSFTYPVYPVFSFLDEQKYSEVLAATLLTPAYVLGKQTREMARGFTEGIIQDIKEQPLKQLVLLGAGAGLGLAFAGGASALAAIPKVGAYVSPVFKVGAVSYGAYQTVLWTGATAQEIFTLNDNQEAGSVLGVALKDFALMGIGFKTGQEGFNIARGELSAMRMRKPEIKIKQGIFPEAPINQQLALFQNNIIEGLSFKPLNKLEVAKEYAEFNLKNQLLLKESSLYPEQHAYPHLKAVAINVQKIIDAYPELHRQLIDEYGSIAKAKIEISKGGFLHDLLKVSSSSANEYFGMPHGEIFYNLYETGNLPEGIKISPKVAKAIKIHEVTFPKSPSVEFKILATADRLEFERFGIEVNEKLLPLRDAVGRLKNINREYKLPEINFDKDTSNFLNKYRITQGQIVPAEAKPVGIHATAQKVAKAGKIVPETGKAEVGALYVSTELSTPFLDLSGSNYIPRSLEEFGQSIMKLLRPESNPRVYSLEPKAFKMAEIGFAKEIQFEGQRPIGSRHAYFKTPAEPGVIEVLGIKTEIEAGARPEAGAYKQILGREGYVKVGKVKVPIDAFKYAEEQLAKNLKEMNKNIIKTSEKQWFNVAEEDAKALARVKKEYAEEQLAKSIKIESIEKIKSDLEIKKTYEKDVYAAAKEVLKQQAEHETGATPEKLTPASEMFQKLIKKEELGEKLNVEKYPGYLEPSIIEMPSAFSLMGSVESAVSAMQSSITASVSRMTSEAKRSSEISSAARSEELSKVSSGVLSSKEVSSVSPLTSPYPMSSEVTLSYTPPSYTPPSYTPSPPNETPPYYPPSFGEIPSSSFSKSAKIPKEKVKKQKSLGAGYNVFGKVLKGTKLFQINHVPLTKSRAQDIGTYYVSNTLARTFQIRSAGRPAQEDLEFLSVPEGYFKIKEKELREFKIRKGKAVETPEQYIQKVVFALNTPGEKAQIKAFREQVKQLTA